MIRTDFSGGWLFAAAAPAARSRRRRSSSRSTCRMTGKYATRTTFTGTARFTIANSLPAPPPRASASRSGSAARIWTPPVFINGREAGQWKNGYTSFWFDITGLLQPV